MSLLVAVAACGGAESTEAARLTAEDTVIAAVLGDTTGTLLPRPIAGDTLWLVPELDAPLSRPAELDSVAWTAHWRRVLADLPRSLAEDYLAAQRHQRRLARPPAVAGRVVRFTSGPEPALDATPRYVTQASRVGFNAARDSAVGGVSHRCGPICGRESAALFVRRANGWDVAATLYRALR